MTVGELHCSLCQNSPFLPFTAWRCEQCGGPLTWDYPASFSRGDIDTADSFIWRYSRALPPVAPRFGFGEVPTPLTTIQLGDSRAAVKLEMQNVTASFKDRGCSLLVNAFANSGARRLVEDSSGNAATSIAGYAARAGIPCTIFAPAAASPGKLIQAEAYGAEVVRVDGTRDDVARAAEQLHDPAHGVFYASHNWHPWFIAGVATWALEVWEQRGFTAPAAIVAPVGSGSLILGAYHAFQMLIAGGEIHELPRLYAAQPAVCAPLVAAIHEGRTTTRRFSQRPTLAEGASIANPVRGSDVLAALRESRGGAVDLSEDEIVAATALSARQGLFIEPTSALAVAAAAKLIVEREIPADEESVVVLTGSGLKAQAAIKELLTTS